jgi:hypothetical protein
MGILKVVKLSTVKEHIDWYNNKANILDVYDDVYVREYKHYKTNEFFSITKPWNSTGYYAKVKSGKEKFIRLSDIKILSNSEIRKLKLKQLRCTI